MTQHTNTTFHVTQIIDGKNLATKFRKDIASKVAYWKKHERIIALDAILVDDSNEYEHGGHMSPSRIYAENQRKSCEQLGIEYRLHILPSNAQYEDIAGRVLLLNTDEHVTAIMLHLPIPTYVDTYRVQSLIAPEKDVEGVNPANIGNVVYGRSMLVPCTALAVLEMVESTSVQLKGARVVCVGASDIVGKPLAVLMMQREATVVSCNKFTKNLIEETRKADILIAAVGKPNLITADMVKQGAIVLDVGVNRITDPVTNKKITVGDVDFQQVKKVTSWISPVPGGVGPMTVTMLLRNTVEAAIRHI